MIKNNKAMNKESGTRRKWHSADLICFENGAGI